jgi:phage/plasmid-like protein (TIGR03299 family)
MAHNLEFVRGTDGRRRAAMIYRADRGSPWHGHGTAITGAVSTAEALQWASLDWTVSLAPVYHRSLLAVVKDDGTTDRPMLQVPSHSIVVRDTDDRVLGVVGSDWRPLQNRDAFAWFDPFLANGYAEIETAGSLRGGRRVWILARIVGADVDVGGGDTVRPYILLSHGHDGSLAIRAGLTMIRVVCENTCSAAIDAGDKNGGLVKLLHSSGAGQRLADVREAILAARGRISDVATRYRELTTLQIRNDRQVAALVAAAWPDLSPAGKVKRYDQIQELRHAAPGHDLATANGTAWGLYQALTEYVTHHAGRGESTRLDSMAYGNGAAALRRGLQAATDLGRGISIESVLGVSLESVFPADALQRIGDVSIAMQGAALPASAIA